MASACVSLLVSVDVMCGLHSAKEKGRRVQLKTYILYVLYTSQVKSEPSGTSTRERGRKPIIDYVKHDSQSQSRLNYPYPAADNVKVVAL